MISFNKKEVQPPGRNIILEQKFHLHYIKAVKGTITEQIISHLAQITFLLNPLPHKYLIMGMAEVDTILAMKILCRPQAPRPHRHHARCRCPRIWRKDLNQEYHLKINLHLIQHLRLSIQPHPMTTNREITLWLTRANIRFGHILSKSTEHYH